MDEPLGANAPRELDAEQYQHLVNRRMQFDSLLWQTPTLALTGEAFLFNIALGNGIAHAGRVIASVLAFLVSWASLHTLAMHRTNELADAKLLREFESRQKGAPVHGPEWRDYRSALARQHAQLDSGGELTDRLIARMTRIRGIEVWFWTLFAIMMLSAALVVIAIFWPQYL